MLLNKISELVNKGVEYLLFGMGFGMSILVAVQVFSRYVLNHSLFWSEELSRFLLVWITFLGASVVYYRGANASVDFLYLRLGKIGRRNLDLIVNIVSLIFFTVMMIYGWQFAHFVRTQVSAALYLPKWIPHSIIPISGAILVIHSLNNLWKDLTADRKQREVRS